MDNEPPINQPSTASRPFETEDGDNLPPVSIPDHVLLRRIGQGSYGEVWLARNMMGTFRAVKIVFRKSFREDRPYQRELSGIQKYEPVSRSYDGFIDILHVGINNTEEYFYYVMELGDDEVSGQKIEPDRYSPKTLGKEINAQKSLPLQDCLQLGLALSQALAELHKHNLVHRDIKPSNIIFVNGVPKLADIGLVAEFNEARSYVGTEGFIPPEGPGSPQADVYSLGKVLYEASTGRDRHDFPELPTLVDKFPDYEKLIELNEVILHACQNEPAKRYRTVWEMHADLLVLANGKSVKRLKLLERRFANAKRMTSIAAAVTGVLVVVSLVVYREWRNVVKTRENLVRANILQGNRALETGDPQSSLISYADAFRNDKRDSDGDRTHRLRFNSALAKSPRLVQMCFSGEDIPDVKFSPDGKTILAVRYSGGLELFDVASGHLRAGPLKLGRLAGSADISPNGELAVVASGREQTAWICDPTSLEKSFPLKLKTIVVSTRFCANNKLLTACVDGESQLWDLASRQPQMQFKTNKSALRFANCRNDGRLIVTAGEDNFARIWDATSGQPVGAAIEHPYWVKYAAFSPDHRFLATACADHFARIWEIGPTGTERRLYREIPHGDEVESVEFSPDGQMLITGCLDGTARLLRISEAQSPYSVLILHHVGQVQHAAFSPDARCILTSCRDGVIRVWDLAGCLTPPARESILFSDDGTRALKQLGLEGELRECFSNQLVGHLKFGGQAVSSIGLSRNGRFVIGTVAIASESHRMNYLVRVWNSTNTDSLGTGVVISDVTGNILTAISDDGKRLAIASENNIRVWDIPAWTELPSVPQVKIARILFNNDGTQIAVLSTNLVRVFDVRSGTQAFPTLEHTQPVKYVEYSPDGNYFVTCPAFQGDILESDAQVWDAKTGLPIGPPLHHRDGVVCASFSPDSQRIATAGEDQKSFVWDVRTGKRLTPALEHDHQVLWIRFSPDGKWVVTVSNSRFVRIWDATTGDPLTPPLLHLRSVSKCGFLLDGERIFTTGGNGTASVWKLPMQIWLLDDVMMAARLISGNLQELEGTSSQSQTQALQSMWNHLRQAHPEQFSTSHEEIVAWHAYQAEDAEIHKNWFAAAFHLEWLGTNHVTDQSIFERLTRAKKHLQADPTNAAE